MALTLSQMRPVYVVGVGFHRYQPLSDTTYVELGLAAVRQALADAGVEWAAVQSSYVSHARLGMAVGRPMLRHLGALGAPVVHIENASASGSAAFRHGCIEVAAGISDVALVVGADKPASGRIPRAATGIATLAEDAVSMPTHFALLTDEYAQAHGLKAEDLALVAVKNHANGALNPNAHRQKARSLEEVLARPISGALTALQCAPVGEGAAAVIIASEEGIRELGINPARAVRVAASASGSEKAGNGLNPDRTLTVETMLRAMADAGIGADALDLIELHDAFTVEEPLYAEATGLCAPGDYITMLREGAWNIGGKCAVSASGGLIAMGHPIGPTGVGQIGEITMQLRGEAGPRQHAGARTGLAHMVGVGAVCYVHILSR